LRFGNARQLDWRPALFLSEKQQGPQRITSLLRDHSNTALPTRERSAKAVGSM